MNMNLLINEIASFKRDLIAHANKIRLNDDSDWEAQTTTISDDGALDFWLHSSVGETDFFHTKLNLKHFQDSRVIEHHLAECKGEMDRQKINE